MAGRRRPVCAARVAALTVLGLTVLGLAPTPGIALPAPKTAEQLVADSDLVGRVRVLGVACTGFVASSEDGRPAELPVYAAWLEVLAATKAPPRAAHATVLVTWQEIPKALLGPWVVRYYPGEEVATHLKWDAGSRAYVTTWWNAKGAPLHPVPEVLPSAPGQVMFATPAPR